MKNLEDRIDFDGAKYDVHSSTEKKTNSDQRKTVEKSTRVSAHNVEDAAAEYDKN